MMMRQGGATATRVGMINTALKAAANYKWVAAVYGGGVRNGSTFALSEKENHSEKKVESDSSSSSSHSAAGGNKDEKGVMSYWGIQPNKITKEDGSEWKWNCFRVCLFSSSLDLFFLFSLCFFFFEKNKWAYDFGLHPKAPVQGFKLWYATAIIVAISRYLKCPKPH